MDIIDRIAKKIASDMTIRKFLTVGMDAVVSDEQHTWQCHYDGKSRLTPDGVARWSADGTLELSVTVVNGSAIVHGIKTPVQEKSVCALFNTLAGHVNDDTYNKYVVEK